MSHTEHVKINHFRRLLAPTPPSIDMTDCVVMITAGSSDLAIIQELSSWSHEDIVAYATKLTKLSVNPEEALTTYKQLKQSENQPASVESKTSIKFDTYSDDDDDDMSVSRGKTGDIWEQHVSPQGVPFYHNAGTSARAGH